MRVKIEDNKKVCQKLIKIEVESQRAKDALNEAYKSIAKNAQIPGFRKGKAPRDIIEAHYGEDANSETIRHLIWEAYREVIKTNDIKPVSYPIIEDVKFNKDGPLNFTVKIDVKPVIDLKPYTKIKINKISTEVSEEDINKTLEGVRESSARFEPVEDRPIQIGDYTVCDYDCLVEGKSVDNRKNAWLHIEEKSNLSPIPEQLLGCSKGQTKEVTLTLPKDYKEAAYAGKKGVYKITVKEIKKKVLPALNDELAKQVGNFENLQKLRDRLKEELSFEKKRRQRLDMENQLFEFLLKVNQLDVPESAVQRQLQNLINDTKTHLAYQGYKAEEINSQEVKLKETLVIDARKQVKIFFILDEIADKENINITDEQLNKRIEEISKATQSLGSARDGSRDGEPVEPQALQKFKQTMEEKGLIDSLRQQMLHDKVIEFLLENARIAEN